MKDKISGPIDFEDLIIMQQIDSLKKRLKNVEMFSKVSPFKIEDSLTGKENQQPTG